MTANEKVLLVDQQKVNLDQLTGLIRSIGFEQVMILIGDMYPEWDILVEPHVEVK